MLKRINHPKVLGCVEREEIRGIGDDRICFIRGWAVQRMGMKCSNVRVELVKKDNTTETRDLPSAHRQDVVEFYNNNSGMLQSGWTFGQGVSGISHVRLQISFEDEWITFHEWALPDMSLSQVLAPAKKHLPSFIVVDNFYENPDQVREYALKQEFIEHKKYHKGFRTETLHRPPELKEKFEQIIGREIDEWERYGTNGCFQFCKAGDKLVYHCDTQLYAGLIYLTPNAPAPTGTSLYRSKLNGVMNPHDELTIAKTGKNFGQLHSEAFPDESAFLNSDLFEMIDSVGNVYNRLILFNGQNIHAASGYFGNDKNDGRLFQLFFFDLKKQ